MVDMFRATKHNASRYIISEGNAAEWRVSKNPPSVSFCLSCLHLKYQSLLDGDGWLSWWRHQMEIFSALLAICAGNSPVTGEFPTQRLVTRSFDVYFDLRPNERLSKQSWGWWFETLSRSLWRHRNDSILYVLVYCKICTFITAQFQL